MTKTKVVEYTILPISARALQLWSWVKGQRTATMYFHGEFDNMAELCFSVRDRQDRVNRGEKE